MPSVTHIKPEDILNIHKFQCLPGILRKDIGFHIIQIGAGGTGGYVTPYLTRFLFMAKERDPDLTVKYTIIDADIVEKKNVLRQNFINSDIDQNKAFVLARRYGSAFGLEIETVDKFIDKKGLVNLIDNTSSTNILLSSKRNSVVIILGCVDNNEARRQIHDYMQTLKANHLKACYWIDSGNEKTDGQVVMGSTNTRGEWNLPSITQIYPSILDARQDSRTTVSCDDALMQDEQTMFVNMQAATHMVNFTRSVLLQELSTVHGVDFDITSKVSPRFYIDRGNKINKQTVLYYSADIELEKEEAESEQEEEKTEMGAIAEAISF